VPRSTPHYEWKNKIFCEAKESTSTQLKQGASMTGRTLSSTNRQKKIDLGQYDLMEDNLLCTKCNEWEVLKNLALRGCQQCWLQCEARCKGNHKCRWHRKY